ncbi:hypothetical protein [Sphingomonas koreensis]
MSSPLTRALLEQMIRTGLLDADDIDEMATRLDAAGNTDDARIARATFLQAHAPSQSEWEVEQRRAQIRAIPDGGNRTD